MKTNRPLPDMTSRWLRLCAAVVCLPVLPSRAFEGDEHRDLGNIAIAANLDHLQRNGGTGDAARVRVAKDTLRFLLEGVRDDPEKRAITYGDIVMLVDYMKDNYRLMHKRDASDEWARSPEESDIIYLQRLAESPLSNLSSAHANQDHFQGRMFYTFWFWHKQAVEVARDGNLWAGLLLNAYADHFLQDSFAPGHIIGPRDENSHDLFAALVHDSGNELGMECRIGAVGECHDALEKVLELAKALERNEKHSFQPERVRLGSGAAASILADPVMQARFYGDAQINKEPKQAIIISTYCTQSVADVLKSYVDGEVVNSFAKYRWKLRFAGMGSIGQTELIDVWQEYGDLTWEARSLGSDTAYGKWPGLKLEKVPLTVPDGKGGIERQAQEDVPERIIAPLALVGGTNLPFGVTVGFESWTTGKDAELRGLVEAESVLIGGRWDYLRDDFKSFHLPEWADMFAVTAGYSGVFDQDSAGNGMVSRLIIPLNSLDLQLSVYGGMRYYSGNGVDGWADFEGVRADWGMQMGNLFLGIGRDHYPTSNGLDAGLSVEAGLSFMFPFSRIPGVAEKD